MAEWKATNEVAEGWRPEAYRGDSDGSVLRTIDDAVRAAANAATFGMADRFAGWASGSGTDEQVRLSKEARERSPWASVAGDVAGSVALPGAGGARLATRLGGGAGARAAGYGAEGALIGAAQGAGNTYTGNVEDYAKAALLGGALGGATGGVVGGAFGARPQVSSARPATIAQQQHYTDSAYDLLRANPTQYNTPAFRRAADDLESRLLQRFDPAGDSAPASFRAVQRMQNTNVVTPKTIEDLRQSLGDISPLARADRKAAREVRQMLDDFLINPPPGAVHPSQTQVAREAAATAADARAANAALERSLTLQRAEEATGLITARQNSGLNRENVIRNEISKLLDPRTPGTRARLAGYNAAERAALQNIVMPGRSAEALRSVGNLLGGGGGLGALVTGGAGALAGGALSEDKTNALLLGGAALGGGRALRGLANAAANRRLNAAQDLIQQRSPLYQKRAANARMVPGGGLSTRNTERLRNALTVELLRQAGM